MTIAIAKPQEQHPFRNFNFQQLKKYPQEFENPISQLLAKYLIFNNDDKGKFLPIPFPTGIGKTHNMLLVIHETILNRIQLEIQQLEQDKQENVFAVEDEQEIVQSSSFPQIIFITDSVDNVKESYQKLEKLINQDTRLDAEQKQWLIKQVIYSPNTVTSLEKTINSGDIEEILNIFDIENKNINESIKTIKTELQIKSEAERESEKKQSSTKMLESFTKQLEEKERELFRVIFNAIVKMQSSDKDKVDLSLSQIELVSKLIPAIKIEYNLSHAIFLTTKKFLMGVHTSTGKYHFINEMQDHTLIIDEIDRQNNIILDHLVELKRNDILSKAKAIHGNLNFSEICKKPEYKGVSSVISKYAMQLQEFVEKHELQLTFDLEQELQDSMESNPLLFSDKLATHLTNINSRLFHIKDTDINQNIIFGKDSKLFGKDDKIIFSPFLNQLDKLVNSTFYYTIIKSVEIYKKNKQDIAEEQNKPVDSFDSQKAVANILQQINLYRFFGDIREQLYALSGKSKNMKKHDGTYHTRGISLIEIDRFLNTTDSAVFYHHGFNHSPTSMLANWVEQGAKIFGISATATCESVIHNFDMAYLKSRLDKKFIKLQEKENQAVQTYYNNQRDYSANDIKLHPIKIESNENKLLGTYYKLLYKEVYDQEDFEDPRTIERLKNQMLTELDFISEDGSPNDFAVKWISKLCIAIEYFYNNNKYGNRYMMAMLNRSIKGKVGEFLEQFIAKMDETNNLKTHLFTKVNASYLKSNQYKTEVLDKLTTTKDRVIVLTTFQTLSSGANPDYLFEDWEKDNLIEVGNTYVKTTDIDSMYLEKPTHLISADNTESKVLPSKIRLLAQGMALQEANYLSINHAIYWTNDIIRCTDISATSLQLKKKYYNKAKNMDYIYACCRNIEQAIGRSNRTAFKRKNIYLMYDHELIEILSQDDRENAIVSHEYRAMAQHAKNENKTGKHTDSVSDRNILKRQNKAKKHSIRSNDHINKLLQAINKPIVSEAKPSVRSNDHINNLLMAINKPIVSEAKPSVRSNDHINNLLMAINKPIVSEAKPSVQKHESSRRKNAIKSWKELRILSGRAPSIECKPKHDDTISYIELETPNCSYQYEYKVDYAFDTYSFFTGERKVSEIDCKLHIIMRNPVIKSYFEDNDYATKWSDMAKYILTPPMYTNIYKGFLGEAGGTAILKNHEFKIDELPSQIYESFDNIISLDDSAAWIDFKNWNNINWACQSDELKTKTMEKLSGKLSLLKHFKIDESLYQLSEIDKLIVCNLMGETIDKTTTRYYDENFEETEPSQASILTISALIDENTGETNLNAINELKQWMVNSMTKIKENRINND